VNVIGVPNTSTTAGFPDENDRSKRSSRWTGEQVVTLIDDSGFDISAMAMDGDTHPPAEARFY